MRVSLSWLKEWVAHDLEVEELCHRLTIAGLEVEHIEHQGYLSTSVIVGAITAIEPIANKPGLHALDIDTGGERRLSVVSGAPNLDARSVGKLVATAQADALIFDAYHDAPRTRAVKPGTLYGRPSEAVLCSPLELGLNTDHGGVLIIENGATIGSPAKNWLKRDGNAFADTILTIDILPNIARCMSMIGIGREVSALSGSQLIDELEYDALEFKHSDIDPISADPNGCDQFFTALIEGVEVKPSPRWMQERLCSAGQEPRNNIVDVSNYVMLELGQPTHMYDAETLASHSLGVRPAKSGERFHPLTAADGDEPLALPDGTLVITSADAPVAAAGIMGGYASQVTEDTSTVLLEAAHFNLISIRKSQTALGIFTEASARFSRGVDPSLPPIAAKRIVALLKETCPNLRVVQTGHYQNDKPADRIIHVDLETMNDALGTCLARARVENLLRRVGLGVSGSGNGLEIKVPPARQDLHIEADIFEEVARLNGYDEMPSTMPNEPVPMHPRDLGRATRERAMDLLVEAGLQEVMNYSLIAPEQEALLSLGDDVEPAYVRVQNPITKDRVALRRTLLTGLLHNVADNLRHSDSCAFFEGASVYWPVADGTKAALPQEPKKLTIVLAGIAETATVHKKESRSFDFYDLSRVVRTLFESLNLGAPTFRQASCDPYHPGICAEVLLGSETFGHIGALHPTVKSRFDISTKVPVFAGELDFDKLAESADLCTRVQPVPKYPGIELDLALIVRDDIRAQAALDISVGHGGPLLQDVTVFDVYRGPQLPTDHKMLGLRFNFRAEERTLTMEEANSIRDELMALFAARLGATLRD